MKSRMPKVLHPVGGRPMLAHVLTRSEELSPAQVHVVINPDAEQVPAAFPDVPVQWVPQAERLGTGHAVMQAMPGIPDGARVLVLYGDTPLVPANALQALLNGHSTDLTLLSMSLPEPTGYGRVIRGADGAIEGIVEERDATAAQRAVNEVNTGILLADAAALRRWLNALGNDNSQGEYYLTDIFALAHGEGTGIGSAQAGDSRLLEGANDRVQLAALEGYHREIAARALMLGGATIIDPERIDIRGEVSTGQDVQIDINVVLAGQVKLADGVTIGPGCVLTDCDLGPGTRVAAHSVLEGVVTHGPCDIGPFARLRPGTVLAEGTRVGNFVETKNAVLGKDSKASHLSYLGDSEIGQDVNIGAGTITCNYDGANKFKTIIEDGAFIGSDSQLVAPVTIGRNATIGAGSTISRDAPEGELTVSRTRQTTVKGWKRPKKKD
jgi:bifunctional UDP-N-acetylglucosamine pyrophosphorylase/glucosamine-1-phosphate N-acetyltransferase